MSAPWFTLPGLFDVFGGGLLGDGSSSEDNPLGIDYTMLILGLAAVGVVGLVAYYVVREA
jgi:hypothetical protein